MILLLQVGHDFMIKWSVNVNISIWVINIILVWKRHEVRTTLKDLHSQSRGRAIHEEFLRRTTTRIILYFILDNSDSNASCLVDIVQFAAKYPKDAI